MIDFWIAEFKFGKWKMIDHFWITKFKFSKLENGN